MRTLRLNRLFDAVFVHDAVCYMTTEADFQAAIITAVHCRPGGVALFAPTRCIRPTRRAPIPVVMTVTTVARFATSSGPTPCVPGESAYAVDYVIVTHEASGVSRAVLDRHVNGLFARDDWLRLLRLAGFAVDIAVSDEALDIFVGVLRG